MMALLLHLKAIPAIEKRQLLFQVQEFTVVIRTVQLFHFYLSHKPDSFECSITHNKAIAGSKNLVA